MNKNYKYFIIACIPLIVLYLVFKYFFYEEATYEIYLDGSSEEYFFVNEYVDHGALALMNKKDVSRRIIRESNIDPKKTGDYEIYYSIYGRSRDEEYEVKRIVHIVDIDLTRRVDKNEHKIYLSIMSREYDYTLLPDGTTNYDKNIEYRYSNDGKYDFTIYLNNGLSKTYHFIVSNYDNDVPEAVCFITLENNMVNYQIRAFDDSGIDKYVVNNQEYYNSEFKMSLNDYASNVVKVYDTMGNYTETICSAKMDSDFKEIVEEDDKLGYFKCNSNVNDANIELDKIMEIYGERTRESVVAAALFLTNYSYNVSYTWGGKSLNKGLDSSWGCTVQVTEDKCTHPLGSSSCENGLDCTGFTSWAFIQAGFDKSIIRTVSQSTGMWGNFNAQNHRYSFRNNQDKVNLIKIGDIVHREGHVGMVIGVDDDTLQVANMVGPIIITVIKKSNGNSINSQSSFDNFVLFDDFYAIYGK